MPKTKLTATDSFGETFTRTTARAYEFVVVTRADNAYAARAQARLDALVARRDEIGTEGIERAAQLHESMRVEEKAALAANNFGRARQLAQKMYKVYPDTRLDANIDYAKRDLQKCTDEAASKTIIDVTWTSRRDLALKAADKAKKNGSVEIVPVG